VTDILESCSTMEIAGFVAPEGEGEFCGYPILGNDAALARILRDGVRSALVAIGDNRVRSSCFKNLVAVGFRIVSAISPHARVSRRATVGPGAVIMPGAVVNAGSMIGEGAILNTNCSVDHDCEVGRFAHVGPGSTLAGGVRVGEGAFLGAATCAIPKIVIGSWTTTGAGAVVVENLPDEITAMGVPARQMGVRRRSAS
jgi:UDP-perosamine 4-acetyltransferase